MTRLRASDPPPSQILRVLGQEGLGVKEREGGRQHSLVSGHLFGEADSPSFQTGITGSWGGIKIPSSHTLAPSVKQRGESKSLTAALPPAEAPAHAGGGAFP